MAATTAFLCGLKAATVVFRGAGAALMSQLSSSGRSVTDLGVRSFAPRTT